MKWERSTRDNPNFFISFPGKNIEGLGFYPGLPLKINRLANLPIGGFANLLMLPLVAVGFRFGWVHDNAGGNPGIAGTGTARRNHGDPRANA